jgi:hypothetical protein
MLYAKTAALQFNKELGIAPNALKRHLAVTAPKMPRAWWLGGLCDEAEIFFMRRRG